MPEDLSRKLERIREAEKARNYLIDKLTDPRYSHEWQRPERTRLHDVESELRDLNTDYRIDLLKKLAEKLNNP